MSVKSLRGIRSLAERYDVFIIDLWGTLHNGIVAYPGAIDALTRLKGEGKRIGLLSNVPRRARPRGGDAADLRHHAGNVRCHDDIG